MVATFTVRFNNATKMTQWNYPTQFASVAWQTVPVIRILCYSKRKQAYLFEFAYAKIQNKYFNDRQFSSLSIVWGKKSFFLVARSSTTNRGVFLHGKYMHLFDIVKSGENMQVYSWKWLLTFRFLNIARSYSCFGAEFAFSVCPQIFALAIAGPKKRLISKLSKYYFEENPVELILDRENKVVHTVTCQCLKKNIYKYI